MSYANEATWMMITSNWEEWSEPYFKPALTKHIYQGIPDRFRPLVWYHLSNLIPQTSPIPTCSALALTQNFDRAVSTLTPISTPSTQTPKININNNNNNTNNNNNNSNHDIKSSLGTSVGIQQPPAVSISQDNFTPNTPLSPPPAISITSNNSSNSLSSSSSSSFKDSSNSITTPPPSSNNNNNNNGINNSNNNITTSSSSTTLLSPVEKPHKCFYNSILKYPSEHEEQIRVDIIRSFTDIVNDEQRDIYSKSLFNVLKAISLYDPEMGYCQGISFVGSILITKLGEEEVFHILVRLLEGVMRDFYIVGMKGLILRLYQLGKLVKDLFPKLHKHLEAIEMDLMVFASPWFLTAFSYHLSEECSVRIIDVILLQGIEAFFSIGLAIFQIIQDDLLDCSDSAQCMEYFRCNAKTKIDVTTLMNTASRISVSSSQLAQFKQQFEQESKHTVPSKFNPDQEPREKKKDPDWVVKKYKLKERISNLEQDLALMKQEFHYTREKYEEEKHEMMKHLQEVTDRETILMEQKKQSDTQYQAMARENEVLRVKQSDNATLIDFLSSELNKSQQSIQQELWAKSNPKKSITFIKDDDNNNNSSNNSSNTLSPAKSVTASPSPQSPLFSIPVRRI